MAWCLGQRCPQAQKDELHLRQWHGNGNGSSSATWVDCTGELVAKCTMCREMEVTTAAADMDQPVLASIVHQCGHVPRVGPEQVSVNTTTSIVRGRQGAAEQQLMTVDE